MGRTIGAVPDVALMPVVKAMVRSGKQPSSYCTVFIKYDDKISLNVVAFSSYQLIENTTKEFYLSISHCKG
ncbi:hypothetical protein SPD48_02915 [Pseudogracilibacillus sp. SE30717A]|uniref:hypothetical protein n=1 Tax=Pseudogracilibacillus sp. SE30717A TaxID=3098293 RepID=UPI00300E41BB